MTFIPGIQVWLIFENKSMYFIIPTQEKTKWHNLSKWKRKAFNKIQYLTYDFLKIRQTTDRKELPLSSISRPKIFVGGRNEVTSNGSTQRDPLCVWGLKRESGVAAVRGDLWPPRCVGHFHRFFTSLWHLSKTYMAMTVLGCLQLRKAPKAKKF